MDNLRITIVVALLLLISVPGSASAVQNDHPAECESATPVGEGTYDGFSGGLSDRQVLVYDGLDEGESVTVTITVDQSKVEVWDMGRDWGNMYNAERYDQWGDWSTTSAGPVFEVEAVDSDASPDSPFQTELYKTNDEGPICIGLRGYDPLNWEVTFRESTPTARPTPIPTATPTPTPTPTPTFTPNPTPTSTNSGVMTESSVTDSSQGSQETIRDSDGDGVIDSEDYAPNDPAVQEKSDLRSTSSENGPGFGITIALFATVALVILISRRSGA